MMEKANTISKLLFILVFFACSVEEVSKKNLPIVKSESYYLGNCCFSGEDAEYEYNSQKNSYLHSAMYGIPSYCFLPNDFVFLREFNPYSSKDTTWQMQYKDENLVLTRICVKKSIEAATTSTKRQNTVLSEAQTIFIATPAKLTNALDSMNIWHLANQEKMFIIDGNHQLVVKKADTLRVFQITRGSDLFPIVSKIEQLFKEEFEKAQN